MLGAVHILHQPRWGVRRPPLPPFVSNSQLLPDPGSVTPLPPLSVITLVLSWCIVGAQNFYFFLGWLVHSKKCDYEIFQWDPREIYFDSNAVQRKSYLEWSKNKVKKTKSEKLAILRRYTPSVEFLPIFGHFGHFLQNPSSPEVFTIME